MHELGGRPYIGVEVAKALCGFVELKAPGHGAGTRDFKGRDKEQWRKFRALPNILYTDTVEWALYRTGAQTEQDKKPILICLDGIMERGAAALDDDTLAALHTLLLNFLSWEPIVPHEPRKLAETLAPLCRLLRADVFAAVEREGSGLAHLCAEIRQYHFSHTDHAQFADKFGRHLTFADEGVVFLDSSADTGAYPLAAIESALRKVEDRFGSGAVAEHATLCAQNVYSFEILVGPYADPPQPPLFGKKLTDEQRRAPRVKVEQPVFVCMGNPPYFREESGAASSASSPHRATCAGRVSPAAARGVQ